MIKKVGYSYYVHISNIKELVNKLKPEQSDRLLYILALNDFNVREGIVGVKKFEIAKYNSQDNSVSLIQSDDWDIANEPTVGNSYCFKLDGRVRLIKGGTKVYHNKWQFVSSDYNGFDIENAKRRTKQWNAIKGIKELKCRIGNKVFWYQLLKENNIEI